MADRVIKALQRTLLFSGVGARHLYQLLEGSEHRKVQPGDSVFVRGDASDALYVLVSGALDERSPGDSGRDGRTQLRPTTCFGEMEMAGGRKRATSVVATLPSELIRIGWQRVSEVLRRSASFRRTLRPPESARARIDKALFGHGAERVVVLAERSLPTRRLTWLLARSLVLQFDDRVAIVRPTPGARGVGPCVDDGVPVYVISDQPRVVHNSAFSALVRRYEYVFFDTSGLAASAATGFVEKADKVVNVFRDVASARTQVAERSTWFDTVVMPAKGWGRPRPDLKPGTCRLRIDLRQVGQSRALADLSHDGQDAVARWARSVTDRTVGLALGGGGAWGFAHVAVLRALDGRVPIDVISGASFGTVTGAFYAVGGRPALEQLVAAGSEMRTAVMVSMVNSGVLTRFVERHLGQRSLEDLVPVLLPVATDVSTGQLAVVRGTSLATAVRASSAFPGALTPSTTVGIDGERRRLVDGGIASNVPDVVLHSEGADFVVAANVVPPPPTRLPHRQLLPGRFGTWAHEFNPLTRAVDAYRSAFILMHAAGQADASLADISYEAAPVDFFALDFHKAEAIVRAAEPAAERFAEVVERRWREVCQRPDRFAGVQG